MSIIPSVRAMRHQDGFFFLSSLISFYPLERLNKPRFSVCPSFCRYNLLRLPFYLPCFLNRAPIALKGSDISHTIGRIIYVKTGGSTKSKSITAMIANIRLPRLFTMISDVQPLIGLLPPVCLLSIVPRLYVIPSYSNFKRRIVP